MIMLLLLVLVGVTCFALGFCVGYADARLTAQQPAAEP